MYGTVKFLTECGMIADSIERIVRGDAQNIELSHDIRVYKVPSKDNSSAEYTIRIDIIEDTEEDIPIPSNYDEFINGVLESLVDSPVMTEQEAEALFKNGHSLDELEEIFCDRQEIHEMLKNTCLVDKDIENIVEIIRMQKKLRKEQIDGGSEKNN